MSGDGGKFYGPTCSVFYLHNSIFHFNSGFSASLVRAAANWGGFMCPARAGQGQSWLNVKGEFYCLVLWLGTAQAGAAGGGGMAGVREEFRSKFNPLAAMKAQRCPPVAVMGQSDSSCVK